MGFKKFSTKVIVMAIVIFCVALSMLVALLVYREAIFLEQNFIRRGQDMLTGVSEASRIALLAEDTERLETIASESMKHRQEILYIVFYRQDGKQVFAATTDDRLQDAFKDAGREFISRKKAEWKNTILSTSKYLKGNIPVSEFWASISSAEIGELELFAAPSILTDQADRTKVFGYISLGVSRSELKTIIGRITRDSIIAGLMTLLIMSIATAWLLRRLMSPFSDLVNGVQAVAEGDMERTITVRSMDEVSRLANEFNKMVVALKERQQMLVQSEHKFRSLFERIHSGILIFDRSGDILDSNPAMTVMVGYEEVSTLAGVPMKDFFKNREDFEMLLQRIQQECDIQDLKFILKNKKTGRDVETNASITCQMDAFGQYQYSEALFVDITHITELEKRLLHAHKMEAVGTLAGGIAHDFNNILTVIAGRIHLLSVDPSVTNNEKLKEHLLEMEQSVTRAGNLVGQILGFARKGMYKQDLFHLNKVALEVRSLISETIDRRIEIKLDLASEIWLIKGDESQVFQSLLNICLNGCDAMPEGGRLTISTGRLLNEDNVPVVDAIMPQGHYVFLKVTDTGSGMDEETINKIFDPFFTTKEVGKGTGLGMAMVHGIVSNHEGYLQVESQEGQGTTITLYFPANLQEGLHRFSPQKMERPEIDKAVTLKGIQQSLFEFEAQEILPQSAIFEKTTDLGEAESRTKKNDAKTVLLVDDEETILKVNKLFFSTQDDYILLTASSGEECIEILKKGKEHIDIVVLDISMPGMGGEKAFRVIHELFPDLPVIIATGHAQDITVSNMIEGGAVDLILKPYLGMDLLKVLNALFSHNRKEG